MSAKKKCDGREPCTVRLVLYCAITQKAEVKEVKHGHVKDLLGLNVVYVDRLCSDLKGCDFCTALAARMMSRTDAVNVVRALGFSVGVGGGSAA